MSAASTASTSSTMSAPAKKKGKELKVISLEEVAKHKDEANGYWLAINGHVYNVTKFMKMHPGGEAFLKMYAGKDCTEEFYALHNKWVLDKYKGLRIGVLPEEEFKKEDVIPGIEADKEFPSKVPYSEMPNLSRKGWARPAWFSDSHEKFLRAWRAIEHDYILPRAEEGHKLREFPDKESMLELGKMGYFACMNGKSVMPLAKKLGITLPGGLDPMDFDMWHEQLCLMSRGKAQVTCSSWLSSAIDGMSISLPAICEFAQPHIAEQIAKEVLTGEAMSALAVTEAQVGSDVANLVTTAEKITENGKEFYVVNGMKKWITGGMYSKYFVTAVRTGEAGAFGVSLLIVPRELGVTTKYIKSSKVGAEETAWVFYENVKVPAEYLMGQENFGFLCIMANFNHERWMIVCGALGAARRILEDLWKWVFQREVFGKKLVKQPVIRYKLARCCAGVEASQAYLDSITTQMNSMTFENQSKLMGGPVALLKYEVTRMCTMLSDEAVQIVGGRALTQSGLGQSIEAFQRTFKFLSVLGGSEEIMADLAIRMEMKKMPKHARL